MIRAGSRTRVVAAWIAVPPLAAVAAFGACASNGAAPTVPQASCGSGRVQQVSPAPQPSTSPARVDAGGLSEGGAARDDFAELTQPRNVLEGITREGRIDGMPREEEATRDLDDALLERRVFRRITVGIALAFQSRRRLTWVLLRGREHVKLHLFCQTESRLFRPAADRPGLRLDGTEQLESTWSRPVRITFEGAARANGAGTHLATTMDLGEMWACVAVERSLVLTCVTGRVSALRAGAVLGVGAERGIWKPAATETVEGLSCAISKEANDGDSRESVLDMGANAPILFAPPKNGSPGVEWVYENSDEIVQARAYRWMPVAP